MNKETRKPRLIGYRNILISVFLITILLTPIISLIVPDKTFSEIENRTLKTMPKLNFESIQNGSFMKGLSSYFEDHFPLRDSFVSFKARLDKLSFRMENNDVYINNSEYLIDKFHRNSDELIKEKATSINGLAKKNLGRNISVMLVPNKLEILKDKLPYKAPVESQKKYIDDFYSQLTVDIKKINLIDVFTKNKDKYLFFKTDHHWTQDGAFLAVNEYLKSSGMKEKSLADYDVRIINNDFYGTLSSKSGIRTSRPDSVNVFIPKTEEDVIVNFTAEGKKLTSLYQTDMLNGKDKYLMFLGGNYPIVRISTNSTANKRLLIIKDSYANALVPFLTKDFNEITMVDLRYSTDDIQTMIEDYNITDILVLYNINTFNDDNSILNLQ